MQAAYQAASLPIVIYCLIPMHAPVGYSHHPGDPEGLTQSEMLAARVLCLPMHAYLDDGSQERVADALHAAFTS